MRFATGCWEWAFLSAQQRTLCLCSWKGRATGITAVLEARYETMDGGEQWDLAIGLECMSTIRTYYIWRNVVGDCDCLHRHFFGLSCMDLKKHKNNLSYIITIQTPPHPASTTFSPKKNWKPNPNQPCQPPSPYKIKDDYRVWGRREFMPERWWVV